MIHLLATGGTKEYQNAGNKITKKRTKKRKNNTKTKTITEIIIKTTES